MWLANSFKIWSVFSNTRDKTILGDPSLFHFVTIATAYQKIGDLYFALYFWKIKMIFNNWYCQFLNTYAWIYAAIFFISLNFEKNVSKWQLQSGFILFFFFSPSTLWIFYENGILLGAFSQSLKSHHHPRKTMFASQIDSWFMQQAQTKTPLNIHAFIGGIDFPSQNNRASRLRKYIFMVSELSYSFP